MDNVKYVLEEDRLSGDWLLYRRNPIGQLWGVNRYRAECKLQAEQARDFLNAYTPFEA
jgi:hypothetical protein